MSDIDEEWQYYCEGHRYNPTDAEVTKYHLYLRCITDMDDEVGVCAGINPEIFFHREILSAVSAPLQKVLLNREVDNITVGDFLQRQIYTLAKFIKREPIGVLEVMNEGMLIIAHKFQIRTLRHLCWMSSVHTGQSFQDIIEVFFKPLNLIQEVPSLFWNNFLRALHVFATNAQLKGRDWEGYMLEKRQQNYSLRDKNMSLPRTVVEDKDDEMGTRDSVLSMSVEDTADIWDVIILHGMLVPACHVIMDSRGIDGVLQVIYNSLYSKLTMQAFHKLLILLGLRETNLSKGAEVHYIDMSFPRAMPEELCDSAPKEGEKEVPITSSASFPQVMGLIKTNPSVMDHWKDYTRALVFSVHTFFLTLRWRFAPNHEELRVILERAGSGDRERVFQPHLPHAVDLIVTVDCKCESFAAKSENDSVNNVRLLQQKVSTYPYSTTLSSGSAMRDLVLGHDDDCGIICELQFEYLGDKRSCALLVK